MNEAAIGSQVATMKRKHLRSTVIAVAAIGLAALLFYGWRSHRLRIEAEAVHQKLAELFRDQTVPPVRQRDIENLFVTIMHIPEGRSALASLARENKWIAYNESGHTVFYVYREHSGFEGSKPVYHSAVERITIDPRKSSSWRDSWGCGLPQYIRLNGVKMDGNQVWIDFETSPDAPWLDSLDRDGLEPAAKYRVTYDVGPIRFDHKQLVKNAHRQ